MLQSLSDKVQLCYERAAEAKERAEETSDLEAKADFLASVGAQLPIQREPRRFYAVVILASFRSRSPAKR
jgi:hypothetical protein